MSSSQGIYDSIDKNQFFPMPECAGGKYPDAGLTSKYPMY